MLFDRGVEQGDVISPSVFDSAMWKWKGEVLPSHGFVNALNNIRYAHAAQFFGGPAGEHRMCDYRTRNHGCSTQCIKMRFQ